MLRTPLICPHYGKKTSSKIGADIDIYLTNERKEKLRELAFDNDCGSLQQYGNHLFEDALDRLWLKHQIQKAKDRMADGGSSSKGPENGKVYSIKLTDKEIDMLAAIAEKDGHDDLKEYLAKRVRDLIYEEWTEYQIRLVCGREDDAGGLI